MRLPARVGGSLQSRAYAFGSSPNPYAKTWSYDTGSAGRLKRLCGEEVAWFNLYDTEPPRWDRQEARAIAEWWCRTNESFMRPLLLLGQKVCDAFGVSDPEWLEWYASQLWRPMIAVPHPSGLNRWYNDSENAARAGDLLRKVCTGELPHVERVTVKKEDS